jgi:hypothetical protein
MNIIRKLAIVLALCMSMLQGVAWADAKDDYNAYRARLTRALEAGEITHLQRIQKLRQAHQEVFGRHSSDELEYWAYAELVSSKRDQGMAKEEADYLMARALNELNTRQRAQRERAEDVQRAKDEIARERRLRAQKEREAFFERESNKPKFNDGDFIFRPRPP